jgi:site-specific DNA recombinase
VTGSGKALGDLPFNKCSLYGLLTNPLYSGKIRHKEELFEGEHPQIIEAAVFDKVQTMLQHNGRSGGTEARKRHGALLRRLLYCRHCGKAMVHTFTSKRGRQYRYYTCLHGIRPGNCTGVQIRGCWCPGDDRATTHDRCCPRRGLHERRSFFGASKILPW